MSTKTKSTSRFHHSLAVAAVSLNLLACAGEVFAADSYQSGTMTSITSITSGLLIMLDTGPPTNCTGTPYGWLLISEANKTMIATALTMWVTGNRRATLYTNATPPGSFCVVNQFAPG